MIYILFAILFQTKRLSKANYYTKPSPCKKQFHEFSVECGNGSLHIQDLWTLDTVMATLLSIFFNMSGNNNFKWLDKVSHLF